MGQHHRPRDPWERGRRLKAYGSAQFTYDAGGIRQSKQFGGKTHIYYTEGSTIHREVISQYGATDKVLWYYYDQGGVCAVEYNGTVYHLKRNLQGDVVMILDASGNIVAKYVYDAWGNQRIYKVTNGVQTLMSGNEDHICNHNPWRYRGYYFDNGLELYYLQSRYYDPTVGRFISSDSVDYAEPGDLQGLNLYAYCGNNPVMYVDPTGHEWWKWLVGGLIVAGSIVLVVATGGAAFFVGVAASTIVGAGLGALTGGLEMENGKIVGWNWDKAADGFMWGAINGFASGVLVTGPISGFIVGVGLNAIKQGITNGGDISFTEILLAGIFGSLGGGFSKFNTFGQCIMGAGVGIVEWLNNMIFGDKKWGIYGGTLYL